MLILVDIIPNWLFISMEINSARIAFTNKKINGTYLNSYKKKIYSEGGI